MLHAPYSTVLVYALGVVLRARQGNCVSEASTLLAPGLVGLRAGESDSCTHSRPRKRRFPYPATRALRPAPSDAIPRVQRGVDEALVPPAATLV
jgi:hypothetical protein